MGVGSRLFPSTSAGRGRQLIHMAIAPAASQELVAVFSDWLHIWMVLAVLLVTPKAWDILAGRVPNIISAFLRHLLHYLQGRTCSSATGQEQSLGLGHLDSASAFPCFFPGQYSNSKSNSDKTSIHLAIWCFGSFILNNYLRASWSDLTLKWWPSK